MGWYRAFGESLAPPSPLVNDVEPGVLLAGNVPEVEARLGTEKRPSPARKNVIFFESFR